MSFLEWCKRSVVWNEGYQDKKSVITLYCARRGMGKTTRLRLDLANDILDSLCVHRTGVWPLATSDQPAPPPVSISDPKQGAQGLSAATLMQAYKNSQEEPYKVAAERWQSTFGDKELIDLPNVTEYETAAEAANAARAYTKAGIDSILVAEELLTIQGADYKALMRTVAVSRKGTDGTGLRVYATTQRPYGVPLAFRALPDRFVIGAMLDPDDIKCLVKLHAIPPEKASQLYNYGPGDWIETDLTQTERAT